MQCIVIIESYFNSTQAILCYYWFHLLICNSSRGSDKYLFQFQCFCFNINFGEWRYTIIIIIKIVCFSYCNISYNLNGKLELICSFLTFTIMILYYYIAMQHQVLFLHKLISLVIKLVSSFYIHFMYIIKKEITFRQKAAVEQHLKIHKIKFVQKYIGMFNVLN